MTSQTVPPDGRGLLGPGSPGADEADSSQIAAAAEPPVPAEPTVPAVPSWAELVEQHSGRVFRLAYRLTGNRHDAEDLTQEVFVRGFRSLHTFTPGSMEGWLHRITTNLFLDQARRGRRLRFEHLGDAEHRVVSRVPAPDVAQAERLFDADVEAALASLRPEYRAAVVLCDVEGCSYEEVADVLGLKLGTVRSRIHRGRAQLRAALAHRAPRPGLLRHRGPLVGSGVLAPG